jgi:hypothetical protein
MSSPRALDSLPIEGTEAREGSVRACSRFRACISRNNGTKNVGMMLTGNVTRSTVLEVAVARTPTLLWE